MNMFQSPVAAFATESVIISLVGGGLMGFGVGMSKKHSGNEFGVGPKGTPNRIAQIKPSFRNHPLLQEFLLTRFLSFIDAERNLGSAEVQKNG